MSTGHRLFSMPFASVYPHYVAKAERKQRTKADVDAIIHWLTGYDAAALGALLADRVDMARFFGNVPVMHPNRHLITGVVCGVRVEDVEDPLMREIRYLDKLVDELARGKTLAKILR